jgi:hypothetical protein
LPVRHRTLAPFGGITRIRFKGSPVSHRTLSHCGSPAVCFLVRIGPAPAKSIICSGRQACHLRTPMQLARLPLQPAPQSALPFAAAKQRLYPAGDVCGATFMSV